MRKLRIHIVGAGAVGLSYGYLLTASGQDVVHTGIRGSRKGEIPVHAIVGGKAIHGLYRPRFDAFASDPAPDVTMFALSPAACADYLSAADGAAARESGATNLILASVFDRAWQRRFAAWPAFDPSLIFPLMSSEYRPADGLGIVTDMQVEVLSRPKAAAPASLALGPILDAMRLHVSDHVGIDRFLARYVETAAVYVVLSALTLRFITSHDADAALLRSVFTEMRDAAEAAHPDSQFDFSAPPDAPLAAVASLIAASSGERPDNLLLRNIRCLMAQGWKLCSHLRPLKPLWNVRRGAPTPARDLVTSVMAAI